MYAPFDVIVKEKDKTIEFPSGAKIKFGYLELEKHAISHQGIEYSAEYFDEGTHYSWTQFDYLCSRLRSAAETKSYVKVSCNPDRDHWLFDWVEPYLLTETKLNEDGTENEELTKGCPDRSLCGKLRYYHTVDSVIYSFWSLEELYEAFPDRRCPEDPEKAKKWVAPLSYTFIAGTIDDNPILDEMEPRYRIRLEALSKVNRARLRYGNWLARPEGSGYFERNWCEIVPQVPREVTRVRCWDIASTLPSDVNPDPDWTVGVLMAKDKAGIYYVEDVVRFRDRPAGVEERILATAEQDGSDVTIGIPQDPAAAGKALTQQYIRKLAERGYTARAMSTNKNKVTRYSPFSAAAEAGLVKIVQASWNNGYFVESEAFTGDGKGKDDQVDATSDAFISLAQKKVVPSFTLPSLTKTNQFARG